MRSRWGGAEIVLGMAIGIVLSLFVAAVLSYQIENCGKVYAGAKGDPEQQPQAPVSIPDFKEKSDEKSGYDKSHPITCGVIEFLPSVVGYVNHNEGFFLAIFTLFLFIATRALARSTRKLWEAGERQLAHLAQSSERQLRAYIHVTQVRHDRSLIPHPTVTIDFTNFGQTPAQEVTIGISGSYVVGSASPAFHALKDQAPQFTYETVGPTGDRRFKHIVGDVTLTDNDVKQLRSGDATVYVYGAIRYKDAFKEPRSTSFMAYFGGDSGIDPNGGMSISPAGNEAT